MIKYIDFLKFSVLSIALIACVNTDSSQTNTKTNIKVYAKGGNKVILLRPTIGVQDKAIISVDIKNENDVIQYFENNYSDINSNKVSIKDKAKEYFIDIVDFIFYDKEIKGYTFSELSDNTKIKVIALALKIDSKIEEYIPGYKKSISSNGNKIYTDVKDRLVSSYLDLSVKICSNNEEGCNKAKDIFSDIKDNCKIGWSFIKKLASDGGNKLKDWYEIYSGKR